jgi:hypothetical protein
MWILITEKLVTLEEWDLAPPDPKGPHFPIGEELAGL